MTKKSVNTEPSHYGHALRVRREELGLSREVLARRMGLSARTIERYEERAREPETPTARATAQSIKEALDAEVSTQRVDTIRQDHPPTGSITVRVGDVVLGRLRLVWEPAGDLEMEMGVSSVGVEGSPRAAHEAPDPWAIPDASTVNPRFGQRSVGKGEQELEQE